MKKLENKQYGSMAMLLLSVTISILSGICGVCILVSIYGIAAIPAIGLFFAALYILLLKRKKERRTIKA